MKPPAKANGTEPIISRPASRRLGEPVRQCTAAPTDLLTEAATRSLATATAGLMPRKIRAGVMRAPPPMPVRPTTIPTPKATRRTPKASVVTSSVMSQTLGVLDPERVGRVDAEDFDLGREEPEFLESTLEPGLVRMAVDFGEELGG